MKEDTRHRGAFRAWLCSLPLALGCPTICWLALGALYREPVFLFIAGCAVLVHLIACLATGLPIFLGCFRNLSSPMWTPRVLLPTGILLGMIAMQFVPLLVGNPVDPMSNPVSYFLGGGYGCVTAIAALRQRPNLGTP